MATDDKKYISLQRFKRFAQNMPWQRMRKKMGLGDTLGVLPVECGGTGAGNYKDLAQSLPSGEFSAKAIFKDDGSFLINQCLTSTKTASYTEYFTPTSIFNKEFAKFTTVNGMSGFLVEPGFYAISGNTKLSFKKSISLSTMPVASRRNTRYVSFAVIPYEANGSMVNNDTARTLSSWSTNIDWRTFSAANRFNAFSLKDPTYSSSAGTSYKIVSYEVGSSYVTADLTGSLGESNAFICVYRPMFLGLGLILGPYTASSETPMGNADPGSIDLEFELAITKL